VTWLSCSKECYCWYVRWP